MPDDSTWKIHKHLKHNMSVYELNLFSFFTPKYVSSCILFLSVNGTTIHPAVIVLDSSLPKSTHQHIWHVPQPSLSPRYCLSKS